MKPAVFHPKAEVELAAEAQYYEDRLPGLGERFLLEVQAAVNLATCFPGAGTSYRHGTRRVFPMRFPFSVVYRETPAEIIILAIAPFPRKPAYWRDRTKDKLTPPKTP